MSRSIPRSRKLLLAAALMAVPTLVLGCSSSRKNAANVTLPSRPPSTSVAASTATAPNPPPTSAAAATGGLSGSWSGSYSGSFSGTFSLTWTESGSNLAGTIRISGFGDAPDNIDGAVQGNSIHFGTVHGEEVQYTGTVSGRSMSGTWTLAGNAGHGSWTASKTS